MPKKATKDFTAGNQSAITALRKFLNKRKKDGDLVVPLASIYNWIEKRKKLYNKRPGGAGRK